MITRIEEKLALLMLLPIAQIFATSTAISVVFIGQNF